MPANFAIFMLLVTIVCVEGFKLGSEKHTTEVVLTKSGALRVTSGIEGLSLLKTTQVSYIMLKYLNAPVLLVSLSCLVFKILDVDFNEFLDNSRALKDSLGTKTPFYLKRVRECLQQRSLLHGGIFAHLPTNYYILPEVILVLFYKRVILLSVLIIYFFLQRIKKLRSYHEFYYYL